MNDVVWRTRQHRDANAWCGEVDDLRRLVSLIAELTEQRKNQILASFTNEQTWERDHWEKQAEGVRLEINDKMDSITGPPAETFDQLDRRSAQSIRIFAKLGNTDEKLEVTFRRLSRFTSHKAVEIRIESANPGWARQCLVQLSEEIDKSVPKWAWFQSGTGKGVSALVFYVVSVGTAILIDDKHAPSTLGSFTFAAATLGIWLLAAVLLIWPWIFPSFELYSQGGSSTGSRRIGAIIAFVGALVAAILGGLLA